MRLVLASVYAVYARAERGGYGKLNETKTRKQSVMGWATKSENTAAVGMIFTQP